MVTIPHITPQKPTVLGGKMLQKVRKKPTMMRKEFVVEHYISEEMASEYLGRWRRKGLLFRRDGRKEGYWEALP